MRRSAPLTRKKPLQARSGLRRGSLRPSRRPRHTVEDMRHLEAVAALGCLLCSAPAEIHHVRAGQGMGQRAPHDRVLPLCRCHHREGGFGVAFHAGTREWQRRYGSEADLLVMVEILLEHHR